MPVAAVENQLNSGELRTPHESVVCGTTPAIAHRSRFECFPGGEPHFSAVSGRGSNLDPRACVSAATIVRHRGINWTFIVQDCQWISLCAMWAEAGRSADQCPPRRQICTAGSQRSRESGRRVQTPCFFRNTAQNLQLQARTTIQCPPDRQMTSKPCLVSCGIPQPAQTPGRAGRATLRSESAPHLT